MKTLRFPRPHSIILLACIVACLALHVPAQDAPSQAAPDWKTVEAAIGRPGRRTWLRCL